MARMMSGVQPTGSLHIGNYLGALQSWVALQDQYEAFFAVVDLHALTIRPEPDQMRKAVREIAIGILASGVDPAKATLFVQSQVPGHADLMWILSCYTPLGDLNRMTQFKDKSQQNVDNVNAGLFTYPILQAADILLYRAEAVPVGEDQDQHLELAREIVRRFNGLYGSTFPEPRTVKSIAPRVLGIDGEAKMSKSKGNELGLFEEQQETWEKLRVAKTDPQRLRRSDKGDPERCNVYSWHRFFSPPEACAEVAAGCRTAAIGCIDCKKVLATHLEARKGPIRERARELRSDPERLDAILADGAGRAAAVAQQTLEVVREKIGLATRQPNPKGV
jgi:tryptophanyl-tRNA synthetase